MAKGRKKKPDNFKLLEGTFRSDRANPNAPGADEAAMLAPAWLPAECLEFFLTIKERMTVYKLDSSSWTEAAAMIAMRIQEIEECNKIVQEEGRTYRSETIVDKPVVGADGEVYNPVKVMVKGHPVVAQRNEAMRHLQSLLAEFGLTPAAISKVGGEAPKGKEEKDPWKRFG